MNDGPTSDSARLDELEMRVVHQDQTIDELNEAITAQWKLIDRLERQVQHLAERVADAEQSAGQTAPVDRPPPHY
ncbi:MAG: SlyX family protein [Hyphomonas sp.]|nr:SlyX family protein [Hyphomonas sp.]